MNTQGKVIAIHNSLPLRMHATPFLEARVISKLPVGVLVDIEAVEGSWMCVYDRATGHSGWVDRKYIQELPPPQPDAYPPPIDTKVESCHLWSGVLVIAGMVVVLAIVWLLFYTGAKVFNLL